MERVRQPNFLPRLLETTHIDGSYVRHNLVSADSLTPSLIIQPLAHARHREAMHIIPELEAQLNERLV